MSPSRPDLSPQASYARSVRGENPSQLTLQSYDTGFQELNHISGLCEALMRGDVTIDGKNPLNNWGRGQILDAFRKYRSAHPDDTDAATIGGDQIMVPEKKESPISSEVIIQIAQFVRGKIQATISE